METQELIQAKKDGFEQFKSLSIEEHFKRQYDMKCLIDKLEEENKLLKDENQKAIEQMLEFTERYSELEHRLNKFLDEDEKRKAEEREKAERRLKRKMYVPKRSYNIESFVTEEDYLIYMERLRKVAFDIFMLGVVMYSNALRYSDAIKFKYLRIKRFVWSLDLNPDLVLETRDQKTGKVNYIWFNEVERALLKEYFLIVEKHVKEIDENTQLLFNFTSFVPLKKKKTNATFQSALDELHAEKLLLHIAKITCSSFRMFFAGNNLNDPEVNSSDVQKKLNHSTVELSFHYGRSSQSKKKNFRVVKYR